MSGVAGNETKESSGGVLRIIGNSTNFSPESAFREVTGMSEEIFSEERQKDGAGEIQREIDGKADPELRV